MRLLRTCTLVALAACSTSPSKLETAPLTASHAEAGPAALGLAAVTGDSKPGGFDIQGALAKIKDSIEKPGPYEAPHESAGFDEAKPHWDVLRLSGHVVEREAFSLFGGKGTELRALTERLRELAKVQSLVGLLVEVDGLEISVPDLIELRVAMHSFRATKKLRCYAEGANNATYLVLAACDTIAIAPLGEVAIPGPAALPIHVKPLLDKLGVQADFVHIGAYKGAADPLVRDSPSKEAEETLGAILDRRYTTMVDTIAADRKLAPEAVKTLIDTGLIPAEQAKTSQLIDEVASYEVFRDETKQPWRSIEVSPDRKDMLHTWTKIARFVGAMPPERPAGDHVAVIYALGNIVDGRGEGVLGARKEIAAETLIAAIRAITAEDSVKAVVLRIDSGGGSAQASELIWRSLAELVAKKPVIVSMSDVAASGGYYIASGATKIYALDDTITGSIGVIGGHIAPAAALAKIGINTFPTGRGKRATMFASLGPWNDDERDAIKKTMESVYDTFIGRVADGRHKAKDVIEKIAAGRAWTGAAGKELGLVDTIGGLDEALAEAKQLAKVDAGSELEIYPPEPTLHDLIVGFGQGSSPFGVSLGTTAIAEQLRALSPEVADAAATLLQLVESFRTTTIQAVSVLPVVR